MDLCSICLNAIKDPIRLNCNHTFCHQCIYNWYCECNSKKDTDNVIIEYNNPCPKCRKLSTDYDWDN